MPANAFEAFYQRMDELSTTSGTNFIYVAKRDFFEEYHLKVNFFKRTPITAAYVNNNEELKSYLNTRHLKSAFLVSDHPIDFNFQNEGYRAIRVYPGALFKILISFDDAFGQRTIEYIYRM